MSDHQIGMLSVVIFVLVLGTAALVAFRTGFVTVRLEGAPVQAPAKGASR